MAHLHFPPPTDSQAFERLIEELAPAALRADSAQLNGRSGQAQAGVDVNVRTFSGDRIGIQCKLTTKPLKLATIKSEVESARNYRPRLDLFIIATTADTDAKLQEDVRELSTGDLKLDIWFWPYINNLLNRSPGTGLDYARQVLVGRPGGAEKEHATSLREAFERPAFLHCAHHERDFLAQSQAVQDTLKFLRTGISYTRAGELVGALPYRRYEEGYVELLEKVVKSVDRMNRHLSTNGAVLAAGPSLEYGRAAAKLELLRSSVLSSVNAVLSSKELPEILAYD